MSNPAATHVLSTSPRPALNLSTDMPSRTVGPAEARPRPLEMGQDDDEHEGLFSSNLVAPDVAAALPVGYRMRALRRSDYHSGFLDCLRVLTTVGEITEAQFQKQFDNMVSLTDSYFIIVIEDTNRPSKDKVVATGALIVEQKFIHSLGSVGHIEDIAVAKDQQGKKLGLRLIQALDYISWKIGCYKCILDCSEANEGFYIKCGFRRAGLQMAHYYSESLPRVS